ncbi:MAG: 4a-hydroxytetrahydrobiopterin dehydratase [Vicinamibacterales bacterium]
MPSLNSADLRAALADLDGWAAADEAISRTYSCASFKDAMAFAGRIAEYAESVDHHPDLLISYKKVTVTWSTHSEGCVTTKDVAAAKATDAAFVVV